MCGCRTIGIKSTGNLLEMQILVPLPPPPPQPRATKSTILGLRSNLYFKKYSMVMKWYVVIGVLIYILPMVNNVEQIFMCLLTIRVSPLKNCLIRLFTHWRGESEVMLLLTQV